MPFVNNWTGFSGGNIVVAILLMLSVLALAIVLLKLWQWRGISLKRQHAVSEAIDFVYAGADASALNALRGQRNPIAVALAAALRTRLSDQPIEAAREAFEREGANQLMSLRYGLRALEMIANLAPLLGLFGTVLGMIEAFQALENAAGPVDPAMLSGGIWAALTTTAVGLALAIPTMMAFALFDQRTHRLAHRMDDTISRVLVPDPELEKDQRTQ
jgi:biopolymer transport protein ExbB